MLRRILISVLCNAIALYAVTVFVPGISYSGQIKFFILGGFVMGFLNFFVKPFLKLFTFPMIILTLGLFCYFINVFIFWLTIYGVNAINFAGISAKVDSTATYFVAAIVFGLTNFLINVILKK